MAAPALLWSEVTSAIRQRVFRTEITPALAQRMLAVLADAPIRRMVRKDLDMEAYAIAERLGWARTYDAEYVALARLLGWPLLTADGRLARGASAVIDIVLPSQL